MKNKIISLFFLLCILLGNVDVFAYDSDTIFEKKKDGNTSIPTITCPKYPTQFLNSIYYATNTADSSEKYYIYCADPFVNASLYLKVDHILMGAESTKPHLDYGVLVIMQDLGEQAFSTSNPSRDKDYESTSQALRMFVNALWGIPYRISSSGDSLFYSYIQTAYNWIKNDAEMTEYYKKLNGGQDPSRILNLYHLTEEPSKMFKYSGGAVDVETKAKELLKKGMAAAVDYLEGNVTVPKVEIKKVSSSDVIETAISADVTQYEQDIVVEITIDGFNGGTYNYYGVEADYASTTTVTELGYSFDKPTDLTALNPIADILSSVSNQINLVELLKNNSPVTGNPDDELKKIYIAYKVINQSRNDSDGCPAGFSIVHSYDDVMLLNGAMLTAKLSGGADSTDFQRFFMFSGEPVEDKYHIPISMCNTACTPDYSLPPICDDDPSNITLNADTKLAEYEYREGYVKTGATSYDYNIKKCILENADSNGSSLKYVDSLNAGILHDNPYCSVYCKEDYKFSVPYKITVDNGRYFRIATEIKGQLDCYSTKIDYAEVSRDLRAVQAEIVTNYNLMIRTQHLLAAKDEIDDASSSYWTNGTTDYCYQRYAQEVVDPDTGISCSTRLDIYSGTPDSVTPRVYDYDGDDYYQLVNYNGFTWTVTSSDQIYIYDYADKSALTPSTIDDKGNLEFGEIEENKYGSCSLNPTTNLCGCNGSTCDIKTPLEAYEEYLADEEITQDKADEYKTLYEAAVDKLYQLVDQFNGCMADDNYNTYALNKDMYGSWQMVYSFNPEIKYSYREPEPNDYSYDKWIKEVQGLTCDGKACDIMIPTRNDAGEINQEIQAQFCDSTDTSGTRCTETNQVTNIFDNTITMNVVEWCYGEVDNAYNCTGTLKDSITSSDYITHPIVICDSSGCSNSSVLLSNLNYVHKVAIAEGKYDTARVYYQFTPSGSIEISNTDIPEASLIPGLPVGLYTQPDVYFYILTFNNIGMYYANPNNRLGRIYSERGLSSILHDASETINGEELIGNQYACTYEIASCTDSSGAVHHPIECDPDETWETCKTRLCPVSGNYCVKQAESYYVCDTTTYDSSCVEYPDRDSAVAASNENYNCCPNCTIMCVGPCVFDSGSWNGQGQKPGVEFKPIAPEIVNPNDREMGYNWNADTMNAINVLVAEKAGNTINEIKKRAELTDVENLTQDDKDELQMVEEYKIKVKLTPEMATFIRNYNDNNEDQGGYSNETLECFDHPVTQHTTKDTCEANGYYWDETKGCQMKKIFCFSEFMSELETNFGTEVQTGNRSNAYLAAQSNSNVERNYTGKNVLYNDAARPIKVINDYWTIYQYTVLDINGDKIPDIGPSWK